jgi:REP element-mobilizing transposase RayT
MGRKSRREIAGGVNHVYDRGHNRRALFLDDGDFQVYLTILRGVVAVYGWRILSYCLMTNHVHVVVETPYPNLGAGMQRLHGHFGAHYARRYDHSGAVFSRPYKSTLIKSDAQLLTTVSYVAHNPVAAGLCARAEDWRRSSHAALAGIRPDPYVDCARLDSFLESWGQDPRRTYLNAVEARLAMRRGPQLASAP